MGGGRRMDDSVFMAGEILGVYCIRIFLDEG